MGSLAIRHGVGGFLESDNLTIGEPAAVVDERHGTEGSAGFAWAASGFVNLAPLDAFVARVVTNETAEKCGGHVRDDWRGSNNEAFNTNKFVGIWRKCRM